MAKGVAYYRGVRGSAKLPTAPLGPAPTGAEALEPGEMRRVPFAGELLGAARVRAAYAAIPLDAFDRIGEALEAEAQAAYLHLLRLAYGEGRNWARVAKKDLMARLRLSERRLLRVLDDLVARGFARPLHRDNRGTLWRVALPREAFGEPLGDEVLLGRAAPAAVGGSPPDGEVAQATRARGGPSPSPAILSAVPAERDRSRRTTTATSMATSTSSVAPTAAPAIPPASLRSSARERELARALCAARGVDGDEALLAALREVRELIDEGQSLQRIAAAIAATARRAGRSAAAGGTEA